MFLDDMPQDGAMPAPAEEAQAAEGSSEETPAA